MGITDRFCAYGQAIDEGSSHHAGLRITRAIKRLELCDAQVDRLLVAAGVVGHRDRGCGGLRCW